MLAAERILICAALLVAKGVDGQSLQGICQAKVSVNSVKYLGKQSGQDQIEVCWSTEAASACIKFGAAGTNLPTAQQDSFISLSARVRRADGTESVANVGENEISGAARSKTLQLGASNSPVVSYKIVVAVSKRFGVDVKVFSPVNSSQANDCEERQS